jgi:hypothetical protein
MAQEIAKEDRSIGELFSELTTEAGTLIRQEIALAQTEMTQKATVIGTNIGFLVIGGAIGYAALLAILAAVIIGLANFLPLWGAALLVGVVVGIVAAILISMALKNLKNTDLKPEETIASIKEDAKWLKKQV